MRSYHGANMGALGAPLNPLKLAERLGLDERIQLDSRSAAVVPRSY